MMTNRLLASFLFMNAIGLPAASFEAKEQPMAVRAPQSSSVHGSIFGWIAGQSELASIERANEWLNSPPLTPAALRGKVILVSFWTYTCINWMRVQPYLRAWGEKYKGQGLVVIGVHSPEFRFERNIDNVRREVKALGVEYPVAVDSEGAIWRGFNNNYWPAFYFIDAQGYVRDQHFGEGSYEQSEMIIRRLLAEAGAQGIGSELVSVDAGGLEAAADKANLKSPENYVGYKRTQGFVSPGGAVRNKLHLYEAPAQLQLNEWALAGGWTMGSDGASLKEPNGNITYRFHARDLHLVMGPASPGTSVKFRVLIDGQPPGRSHGLDVDEQGNGTVSEQRLFQLIRQQGPITDRQFEIIFLTPGAEVFCFTFG
ncbi:MAG: redoxin domain-containing protein [Mesorhizobium sp.]|uniref:redoxin domain-containing protein n=1 Tax=unclassified Mesorhizobium TaxID=325217 RepID=UPI000F758110|nr:MULTISPECIES: redoxin domain-containing protein [unclassified Mesorhizobium]RVC69241.1 redoxin domain-containing protein [Mesorhizobium sp. M00.F.Ca.ET.038.03.1.1]RVC81314.1 redoxin domain-containing protein [Mesorhizobium sp. M2A.F.Ca.ET.046.02.1.1]AZO36408.1 redoxin domain-containing protein [Mesorhizobium sp. M2A.F.Ca.ET.046.03.2.1]RWB44982.1 MAG: redoxin domain-containing protein [Mesorhizobium sp.]RWE21493.1 MAG: redoxin domain-containing protein [Mesorhizobium sp.]